MQTDRRRDSNPKTDPKKSNNHFARSESKYSFSLNYKSKLLTHEYLCRSKSQQQQKQLQQKQQQQLRRRTSIDPVSSRLESELSPQDSTDSFPLETNEPKRRRIHREFNPNAGALRGGGDDGGGNDPNAGNEQRRGRYEEFAVWRRAEAGDGGDDCGGVEDDGAMTLCRLDAMGSGRGRRTIDGVVQGEGRAATAVDSGGDACSAIGGWRRW
ncbi:hypothetical protein U1Q18_007117 [Sarracenia purpurea var. burkii]